MQIAPKGANKPEHHFGRFYVFYRWIRLGVIGHDKHSYSE
jgi:hypothetical protein